MPEMDGLELTDQIRQQDEDLNRYTSIILFTAKEGVESLVEAFDHGVDDYVTKPYDPHELASRVYAAGRISTLQNSLFEASTELSRINDELRELSHTDSLTELGNLRYFQDHLEASLNESGSRGSATCCAVVNIDQFKDINDTHGQSVSDEVLVNFAIRLRRAIRPTDILARIGKEEFAIVMHYADPENLKHTIFKRIQTNISTRSIRTSAGDLPVTASMGVCSRVNKDVPMTMDMLMKCSDQKLARAKNKGGNQVIY
jgi:diguanylate cyclase (GGDEF)-like protein